MTSEMADDQPTEGPDAAAVAVIEEAVLAADPQPLEPASPPRVTRMFSHDGKTVTVTAADGTVNVFPVQAEEGALHLPAVPARRGADKQRTAMHIAELRTHTSRTFGPGPIHARFDESRRVHQAWFGSAGWEKAEYKGEWLTEAGALRRLRNSRGPRTVVADGPTNVPAQPARAYPDGGSTQSMDTLMSRRGHRGDVSPGWWGWIKRIVAFVFLVAVAFGGGALWFADRLAARHAAPAPAAPVAEPVRPAAQEAPRVEAPPARADAGHPPEHRGAGREPPRGR